MGVHVFIMVYCYREKGKLNLPLDGYGIRSDLLSHADSSVYTCTDLRRQLYIADFAIHIIFTCGTVVYN